MIIVFGSINVDLVTRVARLPAAGETVLGDNYVLHPGGKGANQALAARLAGAHVILAGAVGRDGFADVGLSLLARAGVDLDRVARVDAPTGIAMIAVDASAENLIIVASGANAHVAARTLEDLAIGPNDTLLLQLEVSLAESEAAARIAKARGARVALNAAPWRSLPDSFLNCLDLLILNEGEAAAFAEGRGTTPGPEAFEGLGCAVVVTRGPDGAMLFAGGRTHHVPGRRVTAVDTTGAGDTFVGVLAAGLDRGLGLEAAIAEANVAAALACTRDGAQSSMPDRIAIDSSLTESLA